MRNYVTVQVKAQTKAALMAAMGDGETMDALAQRLLSAAGHAVSVVPPGGLTRRERAPSKYADLDKVLVGATVLIEWRGPRDKFGAVTQSQAWLYNAVTRAEARTGFEFQRRDNGRGLLLTRIR